MTQKHLLVLFGILLGLVGIAYLTGAIGGDASTIEVPEVDIVAADLEQLRITSPDQTIALQREGSRWRLTAPVEAWTDSAAVARFVQALGDLQLESVVSTNRDRYARYGVDSTASVVEAVGPDGMHRLVVGNQGPDFQSVYVRLDDAPTVYLAHGRPGLPADADQWRDKVVVNLPQEAVSSVAVRGPEWTFAVRRGPSGWQMEREGTSAPADSAAVVRWLQRFAPMRADGFMDDVSPAVVADSATYQVTFTTTTGPTEAIRLFQRDDAYAVTGTDANTTFQLSASRLDTYVPEPTTLAAE